MPPTMASSQSRPTRPSASGSPTTRIYRPEHVAPWLTKATADQAARARARSAAHGQAARWSVTTHHRLAGQPVRHPVGERIEQTMVAGRAGWPRETCSSAGVARIICPDHMSGLRPVTGRSRAAARTGAGACRWVHVSPVAVRAAIVPAASRVLDRPPARTHQPGSVVARVAAAATGYSDSADGKLTRACGGRMRG